MTLFVFLKILSVNHSLMIIKKIIFRYVNNTWIDTGALVNIKPGSDLDCVSIGNSNRKISLTNYKIKVNRKRNWLLNFLNLEI